MIQTINGDPVRPLGLAAYPTQPTRCVGMAFDAGVNYFFFYGPSGTSVIDGVARLVGSHRGDLLIGCASGSRRPEGLERILRRFERAVGTDVIDVVFAEYLNTGDDPASVFDEDGVIATAARWRDAGRIRYVGATTHDVSVARSCVADKRIDVLMLRYNMAHRRLASAVFPQARQASQTVVAFTATRWKTLLRGHPEWAPAPPTALECYRYCLADPAVEVVLTGATTLPQLRANPPHWKLRFLARGSAAIGRPTAISCTAPAKARSRPPGPRFSDEASAKGGRWERASRSGNRRRRAWGPAVPPARTVHGRGVLAPGLGSATRSLFPRWRDQASLSPCQRSGDQGEGGGARRPVPGP